MKNSTIVLITIIATALLYTVISSPHLSSAMYIITISICIIYSKYKNEPNISHIATIIAVSYIIEYLIFHFALPHVSEIVQDKTYFKVIAFGVQLIAGLISFTLLIFRVQVSRIFTDSKKVKLTEFDSVLPATYLYIALISALAVVDSLLSGYLNFQFLNFVYNYYEIFMYIGMAVILGILLSMVICTEKSYRKKVSI
ncbi:hypothetical protein [Pseudoalteromonas sp. MMG005]|uniref:hypothetical protein n=1 Tax=Pseudoalteromonas sp. MMG005 TaxID=2822682 RepID=UPI001B39D748|nr:hypothetical protein [Pseudoalteromonas sp. MMG005]MBQ4844722.1 hypothetical protein [Pseudoalteromonas sp. MMG005]